MDKDIDACYSTYFLPGVYAVITIDPTISANYPIFIFFDIDKKELLNIGADIYTITHL